MALPPEDRAVTAVELPDKLYFKIGEVARLVGVKPYVLRYWESEFSVLRPGKTRSRHRLYRRKDVETLLEIRRLRNGTRTAAAARPDADKLAQLRDELRDLCRLLERDPAPPLKIE